MKGEGKIGGTVAEAVGEETRTALEAPPIFPSPFPLRSCSSFRSAARNLMLFDDK
jgi:hypothetical protein